MVRCCPLTQHLALSFIGVAFRSNRLDAIVSIKLKPHELANVLNDLDARTSVPVEELRREKRLTCRSTGMFITIDQGGYSSSFLIPVRNVSKGGVAFLHRSMVHGGSRCKIKIKTPQGSWIEAEGKVVRSRHVQGVIHEIAVQFDHEIDLAPLGTGFGS